MWIFELNFYTKSTRVIRNDKTFEIYDIGIMVRVFANGSVDLGLKKWYWIPPGLTLSIIG